jgi:hypothetical protein
MHLMNTLINILIRLCSQNGWLRGMISSDAIQRKWLSIGLPGSIGELQDMLSAHFFQQFPLFLMDFSSAVLLSLISLMTFLWFVLKRMWQFSQNVQEVDF